MRLRASCHGAGRCAGGCCSDELADVDPRNNPRVVMQQADIYRRQAQEYRSRGFAAEASALDQKADAAVQRADSLAKSPLLMKDGTYRCCRA